jgi:hypothetical protein
MTQGEDCLHSCCVRLRGGIGGLTMGLGGGIQGAWSGGPLWGVTMCVAFCGDLCLLSQIHHCRRDKLVESMSVLPEFLQRIRVCY